MATGLQGQIAQTRQQATAQDQYNYAAMKEWRVILRLAEGDGVNYLYKAARPGILAPLKESNGIVFPYTPQIQIQYAAQYDGLELTHSNYKFFQYKGSSIDNITITCEFTAQDIYEANYLLAVIHFFKSVTKMFYGKDENPRNGTPPPLCYMYGLGEFQFNKHPLAITGFNYTLPNDVDYIRAYPYGVVEGSGTGSDNSSNSRAESAGLSPGGASLPPQWALSKENGNGPSSEPTYVPTKIQIQVNAVPIISRMDISKNFSLNGFATGELLNGSARGDQGGGFW